MAEETILVEKNAGVLTLTLNRPDKLNALNVALMDELARVLRKANTDDKVKAAILTGAGRAFCSGLDLSEPFAAIDTKRKGLNRNVKTQPYVGIGWLVEQIEEFTKPIIAAVNGIASGIGLGLACACDIRIASEKARYASIFVKRGITPDAGTTYYLPRLIGFNKSLEVMLSGEFIEAEESKQIGLSNMVVPADDLMTEAKNYATKLATGPSLAIELTKRLVRDSMKAPDLRTQMTNESLASGIMGQTEDAIEGTMAFLEKRPPNFKGR